MAKKIKIEVEITGIEDWHKDWGTGEDAKGQKDILIADIKHAIVGDLCIPWGCVKITSIELVNDQQQPVQ